MELAICKTELPSNKFMLPTSTSAASFYDKTHHHHHHHQHLPATAHLNDILNFPSNYLFNKSSSSSSLNTTNNNCDNLNISSISTSSTPSLLTGTTSSTMRLKKNRKVTFLSNLIEVSFNLVLCSIQEYYLFLISIFNSFFDCCLFSTFMYYCHVSRMHCISIL